MMVIPVNYSTRQARRLCLRLSNPLPLIDLPETKYALSHLVPLFSSLVVA